MATRRAGGAGRVGSVGTDDAVSADSPPERPFELFELPDRVVRRARRSECTDGPRPCRRFLCRYHLATEWWTLPDGWVRVRVRELDPGQPSCALDVADEGPQSLTRIGKILGITGEAVRQRLEAALEYFRTDPLLRNLVESIPQDTD